VARHRSLGGASRAAPRVDCRRIRSSHDVEPVEIIEDAAAEMEPESDTRSL
jgi:hypothetical protein